MNFIQTENFNLQVPSKDNLIKWTEMINSPEVRKTILSTLIPKTPDMQWNWLQNELNSKINVIELSGLLTTFANDQNATCIIRGLRAVSDFEYEFQMTGMNYQLNPDIETIFLMTSEKNSFISSNFVKEVHKLGGDVSNFVSKNTLEQLNKKNS